MKNKLPVIKLNSIIRRQLCIIGKYNFILLTKDQTNYACHNICTHKDEKIYNNYHFLVK